MENLNYESAAKELEEILAALKSDSITIDQLATKVERASQLLKFCSTKLRETEEKVNKVVKELNL
jgi:exodeoxyribonuclease VII small subunit